MSELADKVAVEVMGFRYTHGAYWGPKKDDIYSDKTNKWSPDTRWDHCGMVLDKMREDGYERIADTYPGGLSKVGFRPYQGSDYTWSMLEADEKLATCKAALAAKRAGG